MIKKVSFNTAQKLNRVLGYPKPGYPKGSRDAYAIEEFEYSPLLSDSLKTSKIGDIIYDFNGIWPNCENISEKIISAPAVYEVKEYLFEEYGILINQFVELNRLYTKSIIVSGKFWIKQHKPIPYERLEIYKISEDNLSIGLSIGLNPQEELENLINTLLDKF